MIAQEDLNVLTNLTALMISTFMSTKKIKIGESASKKNAPGRLISMVINVLIVAHTLLIRSQFTV